MPRVQAVPNLVQGVSQQAPQQRRDSQCDAQWDCLNSPLSGAGARPPSEFIRMWEGRYLGNSFFHEIVRGGENYLVGVHGGMPFAIDLADGTDCSVSLEADNTYLQADGIRFRAQSVEDTTFLINRNAAPQMAGDVSPTRGPEALVVVRSPAFSTTYTVTVGGPGGSATGTYTTPSSENPDLAGAAATSFIAASIRNGLNAAGYSCIIYGSTLHIYRIDAQDFSITTQDGNGDDFMYAFKGTVGAYSRLPRRGVPDVLLKVQGESRTKDDDFYVQYVGDPAVGTWQEVAKPGMLQGLNPQTMPHALVQTGYRQFAFRRPGWSTRVAGDEHTSKEPSFIGKPLKDVFYHSSRLGLLYEGGCVWSKTNFPFTFFPDTAQTVLATAPVDIKLTAGSATKGAALLDYAVQIDEALYLWAPRAQFRVTSGSEPFKQDTVEAPMATAYEYAQMCDPLALGALLYTATEAGQFATIRSLQFQQGRALGDIDITSHVAQYLPRGVRGLVASDTLRTMFVYTDGAGDQLMVYNYLLQDREYAQSAWNKWRLPGGYILWAGLQDNRLTVLQQRPEGVCLLRFNLTEKLVDPIAGATYRTRLDMLVNEAAVGTLSYDPTTQRTGFDLPYTPSPGVDFLVVTRADRAGGFTRGREFKVASVVGRRVSVEGDLRGYQFYAGHRISSIRDESHFYLRGEQGVVPVDRLTVARFILEMADTGYTRIEVRPDKGKPTQAEFTGRKLNTATGRTGTPMLSSEKLNAPVGHLAKDVSIRLINDSWLPSYWQTAAYEYEAAGVAGVR